LTVPFQLAKWKERDTFEVWSVYFDWLTRAAETGLFEIIGHADLPKKFGHRPTQDCTPLYERFLTAAKKHNCAIELNTAGLRKDCKEIYPSRASSNSRLRKACPSLSARTRTSPRKSEWISPSHPTRAPRGLHGMPEALPAEAQAIREYTERPRSEFFAVRHSFLREVLRRRWFAYEQTMVMLLQAVFDNKHISRFLVGNISDLPTGRDSLASAMQQVDRTERVLKSLWKERHQTKSGWQDRYGSLEAQSEQVRRTAHVILKNLLG
jgi:hypothetical protein